MFEQRPARLATEKTPPVVLLCAPFAGLSAVDSLERVMPNRIIREAILSSEAVETLGWPEEVFYRRLHSIVDDYGRTEANPQLLRSRCYPLRTDNVRTADITRWMAACQKAGLILGYEVAGKQYLEVIKFGQQQRSPSKYPSSKSVDSKCYQMLSNEHLDVVVVVDVVGAEFVPNEEASLVKASPPTSKKLKSRKTLLPENFGVSPEVRLWAYSKSYSQLDEHLEAFIGSAKAKGYEYIDWDQAFMNAIRNDWAKIAVKKAATKDIFAGVT